MMSLLDERSGFDLVLIQNAGFDDDRRVSTCVEAYFSDEN